VWPAQSRPLPDRNGTIWERRGDHARRRFDLARYGAGDPRRSRLPGTPPQPCRSKLSSAWSIRMPASAPDQRCWPRSLPVRG
jgi:hypothetical protein